MLRLKVEDHHSGSASSAHPCTPVEKWQEPALEYLHHPIHLDLQMKTQLSNYWLAGPDRIRRNKMEYVHSPNISGGKRLRKEAVSISLKPSISLTLLLGVE